VNAADATAQLVQQLLLYLLLPVWLLAGFGDWCCHRVQRIEHTTGLKESLMHLLMISEIGLGATAALLLQIDAGVLWLLVACCVAHELTTWWDLSYASSVRRIPVAEQWVHSLQLVLPWTALVALMVLHRDQAAAMVGLGAAVARWDWHWKAPPLPAGYIAAVVVGSLLAVWGPFLNEWWRCRQARRAGRADA
jgi:hypothetical protein